MSEETKQKLPDPTVGAATLWLKGIDRHYLHSQGWIATNQRFHGLAMAARTFVNTHYDDPSQQEAAFDGMTLALMAMAHFEDIERLAELFEDQELLG